MADEEPKIYNKDYRRNWREPQIVHAGSRAALSHFDYLDLTDMKTMEDIFRSLKVRRYIQDADESTPKTDREFAKQRGEDSWHVFAVREPSHQDSVVKNLDEQGRENVGEAWGFISIWKGEDVDKRVRYLTSSEMGSLPREDKNKTAYRFTMAVKDDAPRHRMSDGLREACLYIREEELKKGNNDILILGFVGQSNTDSANLLRSVGFEQMPGEIVDDRGDKEKSTIWKLDLSKIDEELQKRTDPNIVEGSRRVAMTEEIAKDETGLSKEFLERYKEKIG